ncbi:MAG TPA: methyltransferase domain-containing protein [Acidimicrobiales bacterium]|nr:methyltransferase domain-containing protein [Acidimicrobiales bacterium]
MKIAGVHEAATAFETASTVYEQARPGYPAEAVDWLTDALELGPGRRVVDLAAGTGKLTRDLVRSGAGVIAVEPVSAMRRALAATTEATAGSVGVSVVAGVAQALPFGDGMLDAITVAQGFHWFATEVALTEMHRVLRLGGGLGLIWNHRDVSDPLQAALTELMEPLRGDTPSYDTGEWRRVLDNGALFAGTGEFGWPWRQPVDVEGVADRVASVSFVAALGSDDQARLLDRVRAAASEVEPPITLAYVAEVFAFRRVD